MNIRRANILTLNVFFCYVPVCRVTLLQQLFSCLQNNLVFYYRLFVFIIFLYGIPCAAYPLHDNV